MTASISLRMGAAERGSPFHTLYFIIFLQICQSFLAGFFRLAVRFLMLLPACVPDGAGLRRGGVAVWHFWCRIMSDIVKDARLVAGCA